MSGRIRTGRLAEQGFTLLEVLGAVAILALLILLVSQGFRFGFLAVQRHEREAAATEALQAADRLLRGLIEAADPGTERNPAGFSGTGHSLTIRTSLPAGAGSGTAARAMASLAVDGDHRLVLRWTPYLHARMLSPAAPARLAVVLTDVERIDIRYWLRPGPRFPGGWVSAVTAAEPPGLIRIRLVFRDGAALSWPEIAAAPRRERAAE